jgi:hypothetical protein
MEKSCYVYQHRRLDTNDVFYVGIGAEPLYRRAFSKHHRNLHWKSIVKKAGYVVDIIYKDISWQQACKYEVNLIAMYGRKDLDTGLLVNKTIGGEGVLGRVVSLETREKMKVIATGKLHSTDSKEKMRVYWTGRKQTTEQIAKRVNAKKKRVKDTKTGACFDSIKEAANFCNMNDRTLCRWLNGQSPNKSNFVYY